MMLNSATQMMFTTEVVMSAMMFPQNNRLSVLDFKCIRFYYGLRMFWTFQDEKAVHYSFDMFFLSYLLISDCCYQCK